MKRVYLDQNKWIDLARCVTGREDGARYRDVRDVLAYGVDRGLVSCPLSAQHYMETAKRGDAASRHRLASVMAAVSRFDTIASSARIVPMEIDLALRDRFGRPDSPRITLVFGKGLRHALPLKRPLYEVPDGAGLDDEAKARFEYIVREFMEYAALAGPGEGRLITAELAADLEGLGEEYVQGEQRLAGGLAAEPDRREATPRYVAGSELADLVPALNQAMNLAALSVGETRSLARREGMESFLMDLPSRCVVSALRTRRHANTQTVWEPNDLDDMGALGIAIAYCDVVVTEKQWVHLGQEAGIGERFETTLVSDLADLPTLIV